MRILIRYLLLFTLFLLISGKTLLLSQNITASVNNRLQIPEVVINSFDLFERDELLEISLTFDITTYMAEKPREEYLDALLSYRFNETDSVNKKLRLRARGDYRYRTCEFPPIRLNFRDTSFGFADLDSLNNVKMVTHCFDTVTFENYLMREYLIYKLYNIVTDYSFRVRFLKVRYIDIGKDALYYEQYGFVLEPIDMITSRYNAVELEDVEFGFDDVEPELMNKIAVFQFLLGNSDWNIPMIHNFKIIKQSESLTSKVIPIPYDFDYSGFVNAHYSVPRGDLNLLKITDRAYLGPCRSEEEFRLTLDEFMGYKEAFLDEVRNFRYLDRTVRRELLDYINSFYDLYRKDILLNQLLEECENKK
jgi:hypothetical protein